MTTSLPLSRTTRRLQRLLWQRRVLQGLARTLWLGLLTATILLAGVLWFNWTQDVRQSTAIIAGVMVLSLMWAMRPLRLTGLLGRLEELLGLRHQLWAAYEHQGEATLVNEHLQREMVITVAGVRQRISLIDSLLWLEVKALIAVFGLFSGLVIWVGLSPRLPDRISEPLPVAWQEPEADEVVPPDARLFPPPFQQQQPPPLTSEQIGESLETLADLFREQGITRAIADALDQGDLEGAANELRRLADQLDELSDEAQTELGEAMQQAAQEIGSGQPSFTGPLQEGGSSLENGNTRQAEQSLETLADLLDSLAEQQQEQSGGGDASGEEDSSVETEDGQSTEEQANPDTAPGEQSGETEPPATESTEEGVDEEAGTNESPSGQPNPSASSDDPESSSEENGENGGGTNEEERLAADGGPPLEIPAPEEDDLSDRVLQPSELDGGEAERTTEDSPFSRPQGRNQDLGPDTLAYPWEKRDLIRRYFAGE